MEPEEATGNPKTLEVVHVHADMGALGGTIRRASTVA